MSMDDILKVLVDSCKQQPSASQGADPMTELIGGLLGGIGQTSGGQSSDPMAGMLGNLLGGGSAPSGGSASQSDGMSEALGNLLGGQSSSGGQQSGLGGMMSLLEMFTGAGGGQSALTGNPLGGLLQPLVKPLAEKLNISPEIATVVISFVLQKLLAHHPTSGRDSTQFNIDDLFNQLGSGKFDPTTLKNSGMADELASVTGMDKAQARKSLNTAFAMVGRRALKASAKPAGGSLRGAASSGNPQISRE
ncbi:MAG: hypothetical protein HY867_11575 [Chloroflexi bacterium]|nr:hypothetical protein [Chloroflexota bacterium]